MRTAINRYLNFKGSFILFKESFRGYNFAGKFSAQVWSLGARDRNQRTISFFQSGAGYLPSELIVN